MLDLKSGLEKLKEITKDKVISYGESKNGELVLITDIHGLIGLNHYIVTENGVIPTNPVICKLKNIKRL